MLAQGLGPPVVVIGGGFGGAGCARALRKADPRIVVTLVEANATYTALPHSNAVIGGLAELSQQQFGYDKIKSARHRRGAVRRDRDRCRQADRSTLADGGQAHLRAAGDFPRHRIPLRRDPGL